MKMHVAVLSGGRRTIILVTLIFGTILLMVSYYDYDNLLHQISLAPNTSKENFSNGNNHTTESAIYKETNETMITEKLELVKNNTKEYTIYKETNETIIAEKLELVENNTKESAIYKKTNETMVTEKLVLVGNNTKESAMYKETNETMVAEKLENNTKDDKTYLVSSSKCKIIEMDPFSQDAKKYFKPQKFKNCTKNELLTYVTKEDNIATVHINREIIPQYTKSPLSCCYSDITRDELAKTPDNSITLSTCKKFQDNVTISQDAILIRCTKHNSEKKIYENVHTSIRATKDVQKKMNYYDNSTIKPISVLFIGIDSISRLNFIRALPNTYRYVEDNGWIPLKGYNKMDDNTFPNLMAILTGYNQTIAYKICNPGSIGFLDKCLMLWYKYRDLGYITGYAEDTSTISTFNYKKKGFLKAPTDYYFRSYVLATHKLNKASAGPMAYCTGPEIAGERILNLAKDFSSTFKDHPYFGFFWMNSFSHSDVSTPTMMDNKLKIFLTDLDNSGVTNNTIIIFLSDHGIRFGDIRMTQTGWLEERLPFIYFSFPPWFKDKFSKEYNNFRNNVNKLTTPYDLHMTLQQILTMSGLNYTTKASDACPQCVSLFEEVPEERSCEDAAITQHWCTCVGFNETKLDVLPRQKLSNFFVDLVNKVLSDNSKKGGDKCVKYTVDELQTRLSYKFSYKNTSYALLIMKTHPKAIFETTISFNGDITNSTLQAGSVSRLDSYKSHSSCVSDANLKKYCYCR